MANVKQVVLPDIGTSDEVQVIELNVNVGDQITAQDSIITLESDKASMEVPAPYGGKVVAFNVKTGDNVTQGSVIMTMEIDEEPEVSVKAPITESAADIKEVLVPDIGTTDKVDVIEVNAMLGQELQEGETLITLESDKASMELPMPFTGIIRELKVKVGYQVAQGSLVAIAQTKTNTTSASSSAKTSATTNTTDNATVGGPTMAAPLASSSAKVDPAVLESNDIIHASPSIRRIAREFGVDLLKIKGSGRKGRILKADVQEFVKQALSTGGAGGIAVSTAPVVDHARFGDIERQPLSRIKKLSAAHLHRNWVSIPHVTQIDEVDITEMESFRQQSKEKFAKQGLKLTPLVFVMKAVVGALRQFPEFNVSLDSDGEHVIVKKYFHLGIAVDTANGLVVPVVRDVDSKGIQELSKDLAELSEVARAGKLKPEQMQGSSFTITSLGGIGGGAFTPIINAPDVAILGLSKAGYKPVLDSNGQWLPRLMLPISLSYDHRVIDGAQAARFITYLGELLVDIRRLLL